MGFKVDNIFVFFDSLILCNNLNDKYKNGKKVIINNSKNKFEGLIQLSMCGGCLRRRIFPKYSKLSQPKIRGVFNNSCKKQQNPRICLRLKRIRGWVE